MSFMLTGDSSQAGLASCILHYAYTTSTPHPTPLSHPAYLWLLGGCAHTFQGKTIWLVCCPHSICFEPVVDST